ncbi:MAG TPA: hypothetical protein VFQ61_37105 [Polyangiaceae bacterium]|nr:hypothetical protein [Polyangiaceae bacterium]
MKLAAWKSSFITCIGLFASSAALNGCDATSKVRRTEYFGTVSLTTGSEANYATQPLGIFYRVREQPEQGTCDVALTNGICRVWACDEASYEEPKPFPALDPGKVTIAGSLEKDLKLTPDETGVLTASDLPTPLWETGATLTLNVEGSPDFPPLSVQLDAPPKLTVLTPELPAPATDETNTEEPAPSSTEPLVIDPSKPFEIAWSEPKTGYIYVAISPETQASDEAKPIVTPGIDCQFSAADGEASVGTNVLEALPKPEYLTRYFLDVVTMSSDTTLTDNARAEFRASWVGLTTPARVE